ncbi:MAG: glycosyltransferase family 9 protein [Candidatus Riflebacteria bacterium]|nr:glycosyltransferase family 9 protein [Candidatus Riflebacteria bacterium]
MQSTLVIGLNWIGDVIMSFPAIQSLPEVNILTRPNLAPLYELCPNVRNIHKIDWKKNSFLNLHLIKEVRRKKYETIIVLPGSFRAALTSFLCGGKQRIGFKTEFRSWMLSRTIEKPVDFKKVHESKLYKYLFFLSAMTNQEIVEVKRKNGWSKLFADCNSFSTPQPSPTIAPEESVKMESFDELSPQINKIKQNTSPESHSENQEKIGSNQFTSHKKEDRQISSNNSRCSWGSRLSNQAVSEYQNDKKSLKKASENCNDLSDLSTSLKPPYVVIAPGAAFGPAKRWPAEKFASLAHSIFENTGMTIVATGSGAEKVLTAKVISRVQKNSFDLGGKTSLHDLIKLLQEASLLVCNDSGTMHLGAFLGVPTVVAVGSTDMVRTGPLSQKAILVQGFPCSPPCRKKTCQRNDYRCMNSITPEKMLEAALTLVNKFKGE